MALHLGPGQIHRAHHCGHAQGATNNRHMGVARPFNRDNAHQAVYGNIRQSRGRQIFANQNNTSRQGLGVLLIALQVTQHTTT